MNKNVVVMFLLDFVKFGFEIIYLIEEVIDNFAP